MSIGINASIATGFDEFDSRSDDRAPKFGEEEALELERATDSAIDAQLDTAPSESQGVPGWRNDVVERHQGGKYPRLVRISARVNAWTVGSIRQLLAAAADDTAA